MIQLPHGYNAGTDIYPHVHWASLSNVGTDKVTLGIEYTWANPGEPFGNSTIIYGSDPAYAPIDALEHAVSNLPLILGVGKTKVSMIVCRIFRDVSHVDDNFSDDVGLLEITFHYEVDPRWY